MWTLTGPYHCNSFLLMILRSSRCMELSHLTLVWHEMSSKRWMDPRGIHIPICVISSPECTLDSWWFPSKTSRSWPVVGVAQGVAHRVTGLASFLIYSKATCPGNGAAQSGLSPPTSINNKDILPQANSLLRGSKLSQVNSEAIWNNTFFFRPFLVAAVIEISRKDTFGGMS